ncbi:MAG: DUF5000 domain-containing lipoprotein [Methanothrix sp.]
MNYFSQYPTQDADHVKATSNYASRLPYYATDPSKSLVGSPDGNEWNSANLSITNQRFHIDLGVAKIVKRIYYENRHSTGANTNAGAKNFTLWGSNNEAAFADLVYAHNTNWTQLTTAQSTFDQHVTADQADPKYILVTNTVAYRYYAIEIADNWGATSVIGLRRIELQEGSEIAAVSGVARASIGKISGVAIGQIKSVSGVANQ